MLKACLANMTFAWLIQVVRIHALVPSQLTWLTALQVCRLFWEWLIPFIVRLLEPCEPCENGWFLIPFIVLLLEPCEPCTLFCSYLQSWRGSWLCYCSGSQAMHCLERSALHCRIKCSIIMRKRNCAKVVLQISIQYCLETKNFHLGLHLKCTYGNGYLSHFWST